MNLLKGHKADIKKLGGYWGGLMESYETFWDILGHFGRLGIFGDIWGHLGTFGDIWGHLGTFGDIWGRLGTFEDIWGHVGTCGDIWGHWADICRCQKSQNLHNMAT